MNWAKIGQKNGSQTVCEAVSMEYELPSWFHFQLHFHKMQHLSCNCILSVPFSQQIDFFLPLGSRNDEAFMSSCLFETKKKSYITKFKRQNYSKINYPAWKGLGTSPNT